MLKRLYRIARSNLNDYLLRKNGNSPTSSGAGDPVWESGSYQETPPPPPPAGPLASYYANLELPVGSDRKAVKEAWKRMMKKYHPDLHSGDPEKQKVAQELASQLTEAYQILDKELSKRES